MFTPKGKFRKMSTVSYEVIYCGRPAIARQQSSTVVQRPMDWELYIPTVLCPCDVTDHT